jgi:hypothetical protein
MSSSSEKAPDNNESFVMVDHVENSEAPTQKWNELSVSWEAFCYRDSSHLGLTGEFIFITGGLVAHAVEGVVDVIIGGQ